MEKKKTHDEARHYKNLTPIYTSGQGIHNIIGKSISKFHPSGRLLLR